MVDVIYEINCLIVSKSCLDRILTFDSLFFLATLSSVTSDPTSNDTTTTVPPTISITTPAPVVTTTPPPPATTTTTTTALPATTTTSTAPPPLTTTPDTSASTVVTTPTTTVTQAPPVTTKEPGRDRDSLYLSDQSPIVKGRKFDGLSFIGGMILVAGLGALAFLVARYLRRNSASPYSNLR